MKNFIDKIVAIFQNIIESLENKKIGLISWCITVLIFSLMRGFLENISVGFDYINQKQSLFLFFHFPAFYFIAFSLFILLSYVLTKEKIKKISKASLGLLPFILLAPIFDFLIFQGKFTMTKYAEPIWQKTLGIGDMIIFFFKYSLFGPLGFLNFGGSISFFDNQQNLFSLNYISNYGLKIELILIIMFFSFYILLKTKNIWKAFLAVFLSQVLLFLIGYFPFIITNFLKLPNSTLSFHRVSKLNPIFEWDYIVISIFLVFVTIISLAWFFIYDKRKFLAFIKNMRLPRLGMYLGAFWYGVYLADIPFSLNFFDYLILIIANLAIILSWMFAVGSNDIVDERVDKISNSNRPLASGIMNKEEIKSINIILRVASYLTAFLTGYAFFVTIIIRSCISYLYSNEPFRLKKYPIISTFCLALSVLLGTIGGYLILSSNTIYDFPVKLVVLILVVFTLSMNVIHIKDYEGDKEDGVRTIPVIFGLEDGKLIVGIMSALSFLIPPLMYQDKFNILIIPSIVFSFLAFFLINRKDFKEWPVLLLYYIYTLPVMFYLY